MPSPRSGLSRYDVALLIVSLLWGANFSANKYALGVMPPLAFSAARFVLASLLLAGLVAVVRPGPPVARRRALILALLGVVGNTAYQVFFMSGLRTTTAINGSLILAALPVFVAVLGIAFRVERASRQLWLGMAIAIAGVAIVIAGRGVHFSADTLAGDLLVLVSCLCWAAFTVGVRWAGQGIHPLRVTAITTYGGTPGLLLLAGPELAGQPWGSFGPRLWVALLYSGLFAIVLAYVLWSYAVQGVGGNRTAIYNCLIPVFATLVAWVVLGERPGPGQILGAVLVFAGVLVSQRQPAARAAVPEP
jgi:drug/metabolite transporter (DMT)-like permease